MVSQLSPPQWRFEKKQQLAGGYYPNPRETIKYSKNQYVSWLCTQSAANSALAPYFRGKKQKCVGPNLVESREAAKMRVL